MIPLKCLEIQNLSISFTQYSLLFIQKKIQVLSHLSLSVDPGEILAVIGASGSGKSLLAHAILGLLPHNAHVSGRMEFEGQLLTPKRQEDLRGREIAFIPQTVTSLNPLMRVGKQVRGAVDSKDSRFAQKKIFEQYHLCPEVENLFPFQLSGGMARRILVSTVMIGNAKLVIADEPTPGLDAQVLQETAASFKTLAAKGSSVLFITHDIDTALQIADRIAIFYAGTIVEIAPTASFSGQGEQLQHPYSRALWNALPQNSFDPPLENQNLHDETVRCFYAS